MMACTSPAPTARSSPRRIGSGAAPPVTLVSMTGAAHSPSTRNSSFMDVPVYATAPGDYPYARSANPAAPLDGPSADGSESRSLAVVVAEVFLPGAEAGVDRAARAGAVGAAVGVQAQRVGDGGVGRPGRPSSGRRRPSPGRPATAATGRCVACTRRPACRAGRRRGASRSAGASTHAVAGMLRSRTGVAGRSAVCSGVASTGRSSYLTGPASDARSLPLRGSKSPKNLTSRVRSTRRGAGARRRSSCRRRGRAARSSCRGT